MSRPSIDRLFTSAAEQRGPEVVGVVLSGMLDDGTAGLLAVTRAGGTGVVQDPDDAVFPSMPTSAARFADPHHIVRLAAVAPLLERLVTTDSPDDETRPPARVADRAPYDHPPSGLTCPGCGGALWEEEQGELLTYQCRVGHGYSADSLAAGQIEELERALWTAITALEERSEMADRLARRYEQRDLPHRAHRHSLEADDALRRAKLVRPALDRLGESRPPGAELQ
jgi:two-component system, chemotaxis family, protein-glutamate methylesterase/glutaminase